MTYLLMNLDGEEQCHQSCKDVGDRLGIEYSVQSPIRWKQQDGRDKKQTLPSDIEQKALPCLSDCHI